MKNLKNVLIENCFKNGKFSHNALRSTSNSELRQQLINATAFLPPDTPSSQRAWHIFNDIYNYPLCIGGNERRSFRSFDEGYLKTCHLDRFQCSCWEDARQSSSATMKKTNSSGKIKQSIQSKYGVVHSSQIPGIGEKISQSQSNILFGKMKFANITLEKLALLRSKEWWDSHSTLSCNEIANELDINSTSVKYFHSKYSEYCDLANKRLSKPEIVIREFMLSNGIEFRRNDKKQINPLELDFFIPTYNTAIEIDGIYYHSELAGKKPRHYHLNKTLACEKQGIHLFHFTDFEILNQTPIVLSMISNQLRLKQSNSIPARKCKIVNLSTQDTIEFLSHNHLQGYEKGSIRLGLTFNDELVSVLIASQPRYNKKFDLEIIRFCSKVNTQIQGGFSKLLNQLKNKSLISYASRNYSNGKSYLATGWTLLNQSPPSYYYTQDYQTLYHRSAFQKHLLPKKLEFFNPNLTEWENMQLNGWDRIWDCGTLAFSRHGNSD